MSGSVCSCPISHAIGLTSGGPRQTIRVVCCLEGIPMAQKRPNWWAMYRKYQEFQSDPHPISGVSAQCARADEHVVGHRRAVQFPAVQERRAERSHLERLGNPGRGTLPVFAPLIRPRRGGPRWPGEYPRQVRGRVSARLLVRTARRRSTGRAITLISCIPNRDPIVR